jgi:hypothetical protein
MSKEEKKCLSLFSTNKCSTKSKLLIPPKKLISENNNEQKHLESSDMNANKTMPVDSEDQETDNDWETVGVKKIAQRGWSKIMDFSPRWKWYKMKVLDEYRTAPMSVSLDRVPFVDKIFKRESVGRPL